MKGFIYLLEIAVAAILIVVVLGIFFAVKVKLNWERSDLIAAGNNMLNSLKQDGKIIDILNGDVSSIDNVSSVNINYGLKILGSPKSKIVVGCVSNKDYIKSLLTDTYVNGHWINFTVEDCFDINAGIPDYYDAVVFVNYTGYSTSSVKSNITEYLKKGGVVIGINATITSEQNFNDIFNLTWPGAQPSTPLNFTFYDPSRDDITKYFLGFGFDINTPNSVDSKKWGYWYIWEDSRKVNITANAVDIENKTADEVGLKNIPEGGTFNLKMPPPDSIWHTFKVKKIFWDNKVIIQPLNKSFVFRDFSEKNVRGNNIVSNSLNTYAALTTNNSAIWISDFPLSDEYRTLVKAAIASRKDEWYAKQPYPTKETTEVSSFVSLCCDMPETPELTFILWYKV